AAAVLLDEVGAAVTVFRPEITDGGQFGLAFFLHAEKSLQHGPAAASRADDADLQPFVGAGGAGVSCRAQADGGTQGCTKEVRQGKTRNDNRKSLTKKNCAVAECASAYTNPPSDRPPIEFSASEIPHGCFV